MPIRPKDSVITILLAHCARISFETGRRSYKGRNSSKLNISKTSCLHYLILDSVSMWHWGFNLDANLQDGPDHLSVKDNMLTVKVRARSSTPTIQSRPIQTPNQSQAR